MDVSSQFCPEASYTQDTGDETWRYGDIGDTNRGDFFGGEEDESEENYIIEPLNHHGSPL
jgi:hypothetical protein